MFDMAKAKSKKSEEIKTKVKERFEKDEAKKTSSTRKPKSGKGI